MIAMVFGMALALPAGASSALAPTAPGWNPAMGCQVYPKGSIQAGGACTQDSECATGGRCSNRRCTGRTPLGGNCSGNDQCFAGNNGCWRGKCTGKNLSFGQFCNEGNQCSSGHCDDWKCVPNDHTGYPGAFCSKGKHCVSGVCSQNRCK